METRSLDFILKIKFLLFSSVSFWSDPFDFEMPYSAAGKYVKKCVFDYLCVRRERVCNHKLLLINTPRNTRIRFLESQLL